MKPTDTLTIVFVSLIILGFSVLFSIFCVIKPIIKKYRLSYIRKNSKRIRSISNYNNERISYFDWDIKPEQDYYFSCNSKKAFDSFSAKAFFVSQLSYEELMYTSLFQKIDANTKEYFSVYMPSIEKIMDRISPINGTTLKNTEIYQELEENYITNQLLLCPPMSFRAVINYSYQSPGGRNYYHNESILDISTIRRYWEQYKNEKTTRYQIQFERAQMTDSLRYDVLKRDHFKCTICGASAADGVKLHVDHIKPVSKGGKTVKSNLRTLCERCNLGKGAKFDQNGWN